MAINVQVEKNPNENTPSFLRRFTRRVQGSGILPRMRGIRYRKREVSKFIAKKKKLTKISKKKTYDELIKLGKITEQHGRFRRRR